MNICLVNNLYPPINTGSSIITQSYAINLHKRNHKVVVITNQTSQINEFYRDENGIKVYRLPRKSLPKLDLWMKFSDFNLSIYPSNIKLIREILINEKIEIIHQCNNIFDLIFASAYFSKKLNLPLITSLTTQIQHTNKFYLKILELFDKIVIKNLYSKFVYKYLALDMETHRYINERYKRNDNIELVPFTISEKFLKKSLERKKKNYNQTNFKVISLGHVSNLKNRFDLLKAWSYVIKKYPKAKIIIVGDIFNKATKDLIDKLNLRDNIILTGRIPHEEIYNYIEDVDISCMTLSGNLPYHKGVGVANLETMAFGIPTIIDADDFFFDVNYPFETNKHFVKFVRNNPIELSNIFINLFENPNLREEIGKNGQHFVQNILTWERITDQIESIYQEALNRRNYK